MDTERKNAIIDKLKNFIINVWHVVHEIQTEECSYRETPALCRLSTALDNKKNLECMSKFITESHFLQIQRIQHSSNDRFYITNETKIRLKTSKISGIYLHRAELFNFDESIGSQVRVLKLREVDLLHFQQDMPIPDRVFPPHPMIASMIKQCSKEDRLPKLADFGDALQDTHFLSALEDCVNRWVKNIQNVTKVETLTGHALCGTARQEVAFWLNLERDLHRIQTQCDGLEVALTLEILKSAKRFHSTAAFHNDTSLKQALATVKDYNLLMKNFPIDNLLSATDLKGIRAAMALIFKHLTRVKTTKYPIQRWLNFVCAICRCIGDMLMKVLRGIGLLNIPRNEFKIVMEECLALLSLWEDEYDNLAHLSRTIRRKMRHDDPDAPIRWKIHDNNMHFELQKRIEQIRKFRQQHEQLCVHILRAFRLSTQDLHDLNKALNSAYESVKEMDLFDVSTVGHAAWDAAVKGYEERVHGVEARIIAHLRDRLGAAKHVNEMFSICARFNALFVRPHIRCAIKEYQTHLLHSVREDIEALQAKLKQQYPGSNCARMSKIRGITPFAGSLIWMTQIDNKLSAYLRRVIDVLGPEWLNYAEGQKLYAYASNIRAKVDRGAIIDEWVINMSARNFEVAGSIFTIEAVRSRTGSGNVLRLKVNFLPEISTFLREFPLIRMLTRCPLDLVNKEHDINMVYPYLVLIIASIETYNVTLEKIENNASLNPLVAGMRQKVQSLIAEGIKLQWISYKLANYSKCLSDAIVHFHRHVDYVVILPEQLDVYMRSLQTCPYSFQAFAVILAKIQHAIDDLSLNQYSNLHSWVAGLNEAVESILAVRLQAGIETWTNAFLGCGDSMITTIVLTAHIVNKTIRLFPCIEEARCKIMQQMFATQAIVTSQQRLQSARYEVHADIKQGNESYRNVLSKLPGGTKPLKDAYRAISERMIDIERFVAKLLMTYQSLWDLRADNLYGQLGDDLSKWMKCLSGIEEARATLDTSVRKEFGPVVIRFAKLKSQVFLKYNFWHADILDKFDSLLSFEMTKFHAKVSELRSEPTSEATYETLKCNLQSWEAQVSTYRDGQRALERQSFSSQSCWFSWYHFDSLLVEWHALTEIMKCKSDPIQDEIISEDKALESETNDLLDDCVPEDKEGHLLPLPDDTLEQLQLFQNKFARLKENAAEVNATKEIGTYKMQEFFEDLQHLRGVKSELFRIWTQIKQTRLSDKPRRLRKQLDAMSAQLKKLPARLPQFAPDEYVKEMLETYTKVNTMIIELKSDQIMN